MARVVVTHRADLDLASIIEKLRDNAGAAVAARYRRDIDDVFERLAMFPDIGTPRTRLGRQVRMAVIVPYLVIYTHDPGADAVRIVRILDGRRNITRHLLRE